MPVQAEAVVSGDRHRQHRPNQRPHYNRFDQALLAAKNKGQSVCFSLAVEASFTDGEDASCVGLVLQVDEFSIEVKLPSDRTIWISKPMIVGAEVLK